MAKPPVFILANGTGIMTTGGYFSSNFLTDDFAEYKSINEALQVKAITRSHIDTALLEGSCYLDFVKVKLYDYPVVLSVNKEGVKVTPYGMINYELPPYLTIEELSNYNV